MAEIIDGTAFKPFYFIIHTNPSLENRKLLGNFYLIINLKAKTNVMKQINRARPEDILSIIWEE